MGPISQTLLASRFKGELDQLTQLQSDDALARRLGERQAQRHQASVRTRLLASAVRVEPSLLPRIAQAASRLRERARIEDPLELYVYNEPSINAFVTRGTSHTFVVLSSGAVNNLTEAELEFVIGHELGHTIFHHIDVPVPYLLNATDIGPRDRMQLLAWQRASEVSADRIGLLCCGSLDVAAAALFKTLSGLTIEGLKVDPAEFAAQWELLEREVVEGGDDDHWQLTHPFPPLRMKAMMLYWNDARDGEVGRPSEAVDEDVSRLLAMMDPLARERKDSADPILADFFLWGGLGIAVANGELHETEVERLAAITSGDRLRGATAAGPPSLERCLAEFRGCVTSRRRKLKAMEIHRIMQGLLEVAAADGSVDDSELQAFEMIGGELGIKPRACQMLVAQFTRGRQAHVP